jgi:hypothetical protein
MSSWAAMHKIPLLLAQQNNYRKLENQETPVGRQHMWISQEEKYGCGKDTKQD